MQTFLAYPSFAMSAKVLDRQRLGKQRVETLQILNTLENGGAWSNHPAVKMWKGFERWLILYGVLMCQEWKRRGYKDTCEEKIRQKCRIFALDVPPPSWLGNTQFHMSHRSNLIRKNKEFYKKYWPDVKGDIPYLWPQ